MKKPLLAILAAGLWINASEFFRNEVLVKAQWEAHYKALGVVFPDAAVNGMVWLLWGFLFAGLIYALSRRFTLLGATLVGWLAGFGLMWLVAWNLGVLPLAILPYAVPLSLLEAFVAALLCRRLDRPSAPL